MVGFTMNKKTAQQLVADTRIVDARGQADTIQVWELHRERAMLWRAIALLQIPTTLIIALLAIIIWNGRSITLNVPAKPLPGSYRAQEVPDAEFISYATDFVNLIATYQPRIARRQFQEAAKYLSGKILVDFETDILGRELSAIEQTDRTQLFWEDPTKTKIKRNLQNEVTVEIAGERTKIVAREELPVKYTRYVITMTMIPRNSFNPYGITITNVYMTSDRKEIKDDNKADNKRNREERLQDIKEARRERAKGKP